MVQRLNAVRREPDDSLRLETGSGQQARQMIDASRLLSGGLMVSKRISSAARSMALGDILSL